jgi:hypothetical protein
VLSLTPLVELCCNSYFVVLLERKTYSYDVLAVGGVLFVVVIFDI